MTPQTALLLLFRHEQPMNSLVRKEVAFQQICAEEQQPQPPRGESTSNLAADTQICVSIETQALHFSLPLRSRVHG